MTNHSQSNGSSVKMVTKFQSCGRSNRSECLADTSSCLVVENENHDIRDCVFRFLWMRKIIMMAKLWDRQDYKGSPNPTIHNSLHFS